MSVITVIGIVLLVITVLVVLAGAFIWVLYEFSKGFKH